MSAWSPIDTQHYELRSIDSPVERSRPGLGVRFISAVALVAAVVGGVSGGVVANLTAETPQAVTTIVEVTPEPSTTVADLPATIATVSKSVLAIRVTAVIGSPPRTYEVDGAGTGFVLSADGTIATNAHVISGAQHITVMLPDGTGLPATVVGVDSATDLAVLRIDRTDLIPISLGRSADVRIGDEVIAVGNALSLEGSLTASRGIVSALHRSITTSQGRVASNLIQTDAAINEGDSGGALTNRSGQLVGINNAASGSGENIGFAIPIDDALPILLRLAATTP
ncbi:MAG: S1C family serine protease [Dehalococcoidia bacterium]